MKIKNIFFRMNILVFVTILTFFASCQWVTIELPPAEVIDIPEGEVLSFATDIEPIFTTAGCTGCHDVENGSNSNLSLAPDKAYQSIMNNGLVDIEDPEGSRIYYYPSISAAGHTYKKYTSTQAAYILRWIQEGALDN